MSERKRYLANAFSLNMLAYPHTTITIREISLDELKQELSHGFISAIGHEATAQFLTKLLGIPVQTNRAQITLSSVDDIIYVFQLLARLPEGKVLTEEEIKNIKFKIFGVTLDSYYVR